ncbi:cysteine--tRNA ligase [Occultella gossypii]|uniref:Cysteine--tRNA ligase n=1 Tax=Occultella gossypii TaxID=2800820 RepID=A0ABS7SBV5_9MICO|nr:cysteine--tRNA ligase [Occultella gossypii]MBZ2197169.1 cysteine--tRNA ligase [Occultella gossypii]
MTMRLYDSATREVRDFVPRESGRVGIYLCGATVQGAPHIGHLRSAIAFDILTRWLSRNGLDVTLVRNVTDIDDKILTKSAEAGVPWWAWAHRFEREFNRAYEILGVAPPAYEPRATGHVTEMAELITLLLERGHAYVGDEGNVYFDVRSWGKYGELTHQLLENLSTVEDEASDKRDPRDFALWKATKETDPDGASWPTPWGRGRPGWHLECSAMAHKYLGESFDIHGGGIDLRFPHHENEQAQSQAAGWGFTNLWMHNAWVTVGGEKMSKSLGNSLTVDAVLERGEAVVLRYALGAVHYRSTLEFSDTSLDESGAAWERISGFVQRAVELVGALTLEEVAGTEVPEAFAAAMDDDLNVSAALAVVHEHVTTGNTALAAQDQAQVRTAQAQVRTMLDVLGIDPLAQPWVGERAADGAAEQALGVLVQAVLSERVQARAEKDWARADALRDRLTAAGIVVEDSPGGARWSVKGGTSGR